MSAGSVTILRDDCFLTMFLPSSGNGKPPRPAGLGFGWRVKLEILRDPVGVDMGVYGGVGNTAAEFVRFRAFEPSAWRGVEALRVSDLTGTGMRDGFAEVGEVEASLLRRERVEN